MKQVITTERIPIKMWLDDIEDGALEQAKHLANLPFAFSHISILPDSHQGYGMPIGGVLATENVVIPNAVGVDIGCGMCAVQTPYEDVPRQVLLQIIDRIKQVIPVGFSRHKIPQEETWMPDYVLPRSINKSIVVREWDAARCQLGTLGGGNHFIEIQKGNDGYIWILLHSGSRNLGKQVADYYNKRAMDLNKWWHVGVPKAWDLAFLPLSEIDGQNYLEEMKYCVRFAFQNRLLMMTRIAEIITSTMKHKKVRLDSMINIVHNYAIMENHFGKNVMIHRKGATSAHEGELGIIPGSQGTKSYIVRGKGNRDSFTSCSHGAGRKMGRKQAERELDLEHEKSLMDDKGIIHFMDSVNDLDEAPGAYKNIDEVMENQRDLVDIMVELTPLAVIKG